MSRQDHADWSSSRVIYSRPCDAFSAATVEIGCTFLVGCKSHLRCSPFDHYRQSAASHKAQTSAQERCLTVLRAAPGVHRLIVEALLNHLLPEERADTYRHKEIRSTDRLTYPVRFSWSCLAGSHPAEVYEPTSRNRNAAYSQHSHSA